MSGYCSNANERRGESPEPQPSRRATTSGITPRRNTADRSLPTGGNVRFRDADLFEEPENIIPHGTGPSSREATMEQGDAYFSSRRGHRLRSYSHATRSPARLLRLDAYPEDEFNPRPSSRRHLSTEFSSSEYDTDGVDDLDGVKSVVYSFKPARALHSEEILEGNSGTLRDNADTGASDSHSTETKKAQGDEQRAKFTKVDSTLDLSVSRYAGDAFLGGQHEAELTVPILDFEDFLKKIEETGSLSQAELHALKRLFTQVKREAVKLRLTPEGKSVSHMDPKTLRVTIPADDSRPTPQGPRRSETQFPIETMLQSKFARTSKAREKQQVLWQRNQSGSDECFHIAQLWCVIVDKSYRRCNTATQQTVHAYLENQGKEIDNPENTTRKKLYSQRVDIYNAAELVCQFFLPGHVDEDAPTVGKFWGAIMSFVQVRFVLYFQGIFNHIPAEERRSVRIDDALVQAWMHLLMGLIMGSQDTRGWSEHLDTCSSRFQSGTKEIISHLSTVDLLEHAVLQPLELVSLLSLKLIQDSTDGKTDLTESYFQEVEDLDGEIREKPDRSHQSRINRIKEEIAIIKGVVQAQKRMVTRLQFRPPTRDRPYQTGVEAQILKVYTDRSTLERTGRTCRDLQQQRAPANRRGDEDDDVYHPYNDNDDDFDMGASLTESFKLSPRTPMNANQIDSTKDRQEAAVYAFTMVTIVFLPLGTVSSIFGMNVSDIANLELSQWVFWATALPVTGLVIVTGLWWMGELRNLVDWLLGRRDGAGRGRSTRRHGDNSYYILSE
ncbi:hypothetical protein PG987_005879 [Apiospora arundinis]